MANHNTLGEKGEEIAAEYLKKQAYKILERNWRFKKTEVDIIALDGEIMVIVEVKTRSYQFTENLSEIVTRRKQKAIINVADAYVQIKGISREVRIDIIYIVMQDENYRLEHVKDAFTAIG